MKATSVFDALSDIGAMRFKISTHTPDINCIENVFHTMHKEIQEDVVEQGIQKETFCSFKNNLESLFEILVFTILPESLTICRNRLT